MYPEDVFFMVQSRNFGTFTDAVRVKNTVHFRNYSVAFFTIIIRKSYNISVKVNKEIEYLFTNRQMFVKH